MSLVECPECKQPVSTLAATCPHCGAPLQAAASPTPSPTPTPTPTPPTPTPPTPTPTATPATPTPALTPPAAPAPEPAQPARGFSWSLVILVLVIGGILFLQRKTPQAPEAPAAPAPKWIIDNVDATDVCTVVGEYCIRVRCAITNAGSAPGIAQVAADLAEDSVVIATRRATRSVDPGRQDTLALDFPEANLGKDHSFRCYQKQ